MLKLGGLLKNELSMFIVIICQWVCCLVNSIHFFFFFSDAHSTPLKQAPSSNEIDFNRHASNNDLILSQSWTVEASPEKLEEFEKSLYEIEDEAQFQKEVSWRSKEIEGTWITNFKAIS